MAREEYVRSRTCLALLLIDMDVGRTNSVMFSALWTSVPIFVSCVSFLTYVLTGHQLTIPVAFTVSLITWDMAVSELNYHVKGYFFVRHVAVCRYHSNN